MPQVSSEADYSHLQNSDYLLLLLHTGAADFSSTPVEITFVAGGAATIRLDPGIEIVDDEINEVEQLFALILEVADAIDPARVDLQSGRYASLARIFDDDRKGTNLIHKIIYYRHKEIN